MSARAHATVRPATSDDGLSPVAAAYRRAGPYLAASNTLMASVAGFSALGYGLDRWLDHADPWMLATGSVFGIVFGFLGFFTRVLRADAEEKRRRACAQPRDDVVTPSRAG
jgi:ATP synthase protein I